MTGADVKRQVMEALRGRYTTDRNIADAADAALAPCIVLTAEEAAEIQDLVADLAERPEPAETWRKGHRILELLTPEQP